MENVFIVRYRRALRELQGAYRLQYALVDESDALRTLAYQQAHTAEKAILKNRKSGRGFLTSRLRECLDEEPYAWAITQHIRRGIEEMEANRYDSEISDEQNHALYLVIEDAIICLLDVLGSQYPKVLTGAAIVTYRGNVLVSELVLKFGPTHLQRIVRQLLKAAADNPASAVANIEAPQPGSPAHDTPLAEPFTNLLLNYSLDELKALLTELGLLDKGTGLASPAASPGAWVGVIHALIDEKRPRLRGSKAAICKAFTCTFGAVVSERTVQYGLGTNQSEAEQFQDRALSLLKA